ncbi:MAG: anaerobic glycerol-3-phosphate dehydrogenase subunit C [Firmicutes bacterium HGW-Firmicutes-14]|nr:MAG: anaerobic glycerol-3-phosphate dehydrogenase subunit C [Firmicutes bacterium HGW-Firmicutes-14]
MSFEPNKAENLDACIKCSACTALCPVAAVNPLFPGPKILGPDAERFRLEGLQIGTTLLNYCSKCKTCEITCPSGVKITEMITRAQEDAKISGGGKTLQFSIRDYLFGRAEYLGRLAMISPNLTNVLLKAPPVRKILAQVLGISSEAPLPAYNPKFKGTETGRQSKKQVVYFPGCFVTYNDPPTGQAIVKVLEHNGYEVIVPSFHCCGTPLEGNGYLNEAKEIAKKNLALMDPFMRAGIPLITGCTSCGLALKECPSFEEPESELQTYDLFEFLWQLHEQNELRENFNEVQVSLGYHASCHLKAQGIGTPSVRLLRLIPGVQVAELDQGCCGLSGSYGFKKEKYNTAMQIGNPLFNRVRQGVASGEFQSVITECGGCQVQIRHGSGIKTEHPIWVLMQAYGLN